MAMDDAANANAAEKQVEAHSAVFKKALGVKDLVLAQVLTVIGGGGAIGLAAKLGPDHLSFWLLAILFFFLPLAAVVIYLNKIMPHEGGTYQWAKLSFNEFAGFFVAWNTWLFAIVFMSAIGLSVATSLSYALGPHAAWMAGSSWFIAAMSCTVIGALALVATFGLGVGKWVHNVGGLILLFVFGVLVALPLLNLSQDIPASYPPLTITMPPLSLLTATVFVKITVFAFGGFEYVAILAGECRNPARAIRQSVLIAMPLIGLMYIFGTNSFLTLIKPEDVDLINPFAQAFTAGFGSFEVVANLLSGTILAMMAREISQASLTFTGNTRLPMVAGWDHLLPAWFTKLHTKFKTPVNSILFVWAMTLCVGLAGNFEVGQQEAYQLLQSAAGIFIATPLLVLFTIPLFGSGNVSRRIPPWVKIFSVTGFLLTLLFIILSIFPIIEVQSRLAYSVKIIGIIVITNLLGILIFVGAGKRRNQKMNFGV
jgi:amino acid transporter